MTDATKLTPIGIEVGSRLRLRWMDLTGMESFGLTLSETIAVAREGRRKEIVTDLADLHERALEEKSTPQALMLNLGRSGSTLVTRQMRRISGCRVYPEPPVVNDALILRNRFRSDGDFIKFVGDLLVVLSAAHCADESNVVLKLSSWNIINADLFAKALPGAKLVLLYRNPLEIIRSYECSPPPWIAVKSKLRSLAGLSCDQIGAAESARNFAIKVLIASISAIKQVPAECFLPVGYSELPVASWSKIAPAFGFEVTATDISGMKEEAVFYSKDRSDRSVFAPRKSAGDWKTPDAPSEVRLCRVFSEMIDHLKGGSNSAPRNLSG